MKEWELFAIAVGLAMDAFAVSICKGLTLRKATVRPALTAGLYFGGFQAVMPLIGYVLGSRFSVFISRIDHWIAFILLGLIGANMIRESLGETESVNDSFDGKTMIPLAVATSIDALVVGVTLAFLQVNLLQALLIIGITTFVLSFSGVLLGHLLGQRFQSKAELVGGLILIGMGIKILIEHLGLF